MHLYLEGMGGDFVGSEILQIRPEHVPEIEHDIDSAYVLQCHKYTIQETNISHLGKKENHRLKCALGKGYVSVPEGIYVYNYMLYFMSMHS